MSILQCGELFVSGRVCERPRREILFERRNLHVATTACFSYDSSHDYIHCLSDLQDQVASISWKTDHCCSDLDPAGKRKDRVGLFTGQLFCYRDLDQSSHRANTYILDMGHALPPGVYAGEPGSGLDRSQQSKVLCAGPLRAQHQSSDHLPISCSALTQQVNYSQENLVG